MNRLQTQNLSVEIAGKIVCRDLSLRLGSGEVWALLGANGSGKTTLLHTLAGLRAAENGEVLLNNRDIQQQSRRTIARDLALLPQHHEDAFPGSVLDTALLGRHPHLGRWSMETSEDFAIARQALSDVELQHRSTQSVATLSGGERQRLALATFMTQQATVGLLDEPTNHLDLGHRVRLLQFICEHYRANGQTLLMSLHDVNLAARFCDHAILLTGDGKVLHGTTAAVVNAENLSTVFGHPIETLVHNDHNLFIPR